MKLYVDAVHSALYIPPLFVGEFLELCLLNITNKIVITLVLITYKLFSYFVYTFVNANNVLCSAISHGLPPLLCESV